jgi:FkbM family methyltransferase
MTKLLLKLIISLPRGGYLALRIFTSFITSLKSYDLELNTAKNLTIKADLRENIFFTLLKYGYYKHQVTEDFIISSIVSKNNTVIDIGANIGWISLILAESVGSSGKVYSFEPSSKIFNYLKQISEKRKQIFPYKMAMSNENGEVSFTNEKYSDLSHISSNTTKNSETVECKTLDRFVSEQNITSIDLIKVDVEGHDCQVIEGGLKTLESYSPYLMFEALSEKELENIINLLPIEYDIYNIVNQYPFSVINSFNMTNNYLAIPSNKSNEVPNFLFDREFLVHKKR